MGVSPSIPSYSYDQIYLPADCFRPCHPSSCFCNGKHHSHSRSKYVYIERNNPYLNSPYTSPSQGVREIYRDPADFMDRFLLANGGGGGGYGAPAGGGGFIPPPGWSSPALWRAKDYDMMARVLGQVLAQQRGITEVPWAEMPLPIQMQMQMPNYNGGPAPWYAGNWGGPWGGGGGDGEFFGGGKKRMAELVDEATKAQNERVKELFDKLQDVNDCLFGSAAELREKRFEQSMLRHLQPLMPELAKLIAMQQMGLAGGAGAQGLMQGLGMGGAMPMGGMPMGGGMGMGVPGMNPLAGMGGMGGMGGMNPMMNPFGMGGGGIPGMNPMMGGGGDPGMMAVGGEMGGGLGKRRNRGRRAMRELDFEDDEDDLDFGRGRRRRGRRGGGRYDDLDDLFGDRGGDGSRSPRGPLRGGRRPRPGNGSSNGGAVFDTFNDDARFRSAPAGMPQQQPQPQQPPPQWTSPTERPASGAPPFTPMPTAPPDRILTPIQEPLHSSPPPIPVTRPPSGVVGGWPPPGSVPIPGEGAPPYRSQPGTFDMPGPPMYPGGHVGGNPSGRPDMSRHVSFEPERDLNRPREEEENRGEPEAGGPMGRRDL